MIKVTDIRKRFGALEVLRGVSLDVTAGEVVSVVGASGAGKTTLLQILGTLSAPDSGRVEIDGTDTFSLCDKALSKFRNERIGFVFQFHHLLPEFTAFENICIPGYIGRRDRGQVERRAAELLALLGLTPRRDHKPGQLSGGEQQRVAIARALINSPAVLLADEPSGNLDSRNRDEIHRLFFELRDRLGQTTIIVTHDESLAAMADRRIVMSDGRIVSDAPLVFPSVRAGTSAESRSDNCISGSGISGCTPDCPVPDEPLSVEPETSRSLGESLPGDRTSDRFVPSDRIGNDGER